MAESTSTIPAGLCQCGCGQRTTVYYGKPRRFLSGHNPARGKPRLLIEYVEEDRGYLSPCWIWQGVLTETGYPRKGRKRAHKLYYVARFGPVPTGLELDHGCNVRCCVNPDHLKAVTHAENCQRQRTTKLTMEKVEEIRRTYRAGGWTTRSLAKQLGLSQSTISHAVTERYWRKP